MNTEAQAEMPRYKCHKEVHALKLKDIQHGQSEFGKCTLIPEDENFAPIDVDSDWCVDKIPPDGSREGDNGYLVVYKDGYRSWSPTKAFEEGYARTEPNALELGAAVREEGLQGP